MMHSSTDAPRCVLNAAIFFPEGCRPSQPLQGHGFLLHGARAVGKTSLAFQAAIRTVQSADGNVVVLCQESALYAKVPQPFSPLASLSEAELARIEFIYVESWMAALREMMAFRATRAVPCLVLLDDDGFELAPSSASVAGERGRRGGGRAGVPPDAAVARAIASCLSYLENLHDWMDRNSCPFFYILVTNHLPESAVQLSLPYAAFPLVNAWVGASGAVHLTPPPFDSTVVSPAYLEWHNGLRLKS